MSRTAGEAAGKVACLKRSIDFDRVLRQRSRGISAHFALHHLPAVPSVRARGAATGPPKLELSTERLPIERHPVDDHLPTDPPAAVSEGLATAPDQIWLGTVVPKRHARRAVTRTLLKRQIRTAVRQHAAALPAGLWVVRLRAPFDRESFTSAASPRLRQTAREELDRLLLKGGAGSRAARSTTS